MLAQLKKQNPSLPLYSVTKSAFAPYGRVLNIDTSAIVRAGEKIPMPQSGSRYEAATPAFEILPVATQIRDACFGQLDTQVGYCWGYSSQLNAWEWHTCSEVNIAVTDLILLVAQRQQLDEDFHIDSGAAKAFFVPKGTAIEVYATTLHFCPCQVGDGGFGCVVALPRGTNTPLEQREHAPLLWAKNKWLIAHQQNTALLQRGAVPGITGENITVRY